MCEASVNAKSEVRTCEVCAYSTLYVRRYEVRVIGFNVNSCSLLVARAGADRGARSTLQRLREPTLTLQATRL